MTILEKRLRRFVSSLYIVLRLRHVLSLSQKQITGSLFASSRRLQRHSQSQNVGYPFINKNITHHLFGNK